VHAKRVVVSLEVLQVTMVLLEPYFFLMLVDDCVKTMFLHIFWMFDANIAMKQCHTLSHLLSYCLI
jgi:hypothetical protein